MAPVAPGWQLALQGITHHIPSFLRTPAEAIIGEACYNTLIYNADLTDTPCLRLSISKGLGLGIVVFGSIMKVPQMLKIIHAHSAQGISLGAYVLEVLSYSISLAYAVRKQLPFSTYGENASLTLQNMVILMLLLAYGSSPQSRGPKMAVAAAVLAVLTGFLYTESLCSASLLALLQAATIPISLLSKVPQIVELQTRRAPGQLSAIVVFAQFAGTLARIFTSLTETDDPLLFWGFALGAGFNAIILTQLLVFWNGNEANKEKTE